MKWTPRTDIDYYLLGFCDRREFALNPNSGRFTCPAPKGTPEYVGFYDG